MFHYTEEFRSAAVGSAVTVVRCEKCCCTFHYRLVRRGRGQGSAPYGIGRGAAHRRAERRAHLVLDKRLVRDIDPVPCPDCGWFQADMVREFRRRHYGWMARAGWASAFVGLVAAFGVVASALDAGTNLGALPDGALWFLRVAVAVMLLGVSLPLVVRPLLRRSLDLNGRYPEPPALVPGMARAFRAGEDETVGQPPAVANDPAAAPAAPRPLSDERIPPRSARRWVTVQVLRIAHPPHCCSCLQPTQELTHFRHGEHAEVPARMCPDCQGRLLSRRKTWVAAGVSLGVGAFCDLAILYFFNPSGALALTLLCLFFAALLGAVVVPFTLGSLPPVRFRRFSRQFNTLQVRFRNSVYNMAFAEANAPAPPAANSGRPR